MKPKKVSSVYHHERDRVRRKPKRNEAGPGDHCRLNQIESKRRGWPGGAQISPSREWNSLKFCLCFFGGWFFFFFFCLFFLGFVFVFFWFIFGFCLVVLFFWVFLSLVFFV